MYILRVENEKANDLAQQAFDYKALQLAMVQQFLFIVEVATLSQ